MISEKLKAAVADQRRRNKAFFKPAPMPCGSVRDGCGLFNEFGQCVECGWLRPTSGDPIRVAPLGPGGFCLLGLSSEEIAYIKENLNA